MLRSDDRPLAPPRRFLPALLLACLTAGAVGAAGVAGAAGAVSAAGAAQADPAAAPAPAPAPVVAPAPLPAPPVRVLLMTTLGNITLALDAERAPVTTANFLRYVDQKRFDGIGFYRALPIGDDGRYGLVQGGAKGDPKRVLKPIAHESPAQTGLSHVDGAISMARMAPGSATGDFFIVLGGLTSLDGNAAAGDPGYAVFGRVAEGMDVVRQILAQPHDPEAGAESGMKGQMLARPVQIVQARRLPPEPVPVPVPVVADAPPATTAPDGSP
jgi:peptidyl-prolyl cis-trans isomerase A (cyclophilin A)